MPVRVVYYQGLAQDQNGLPTLVLDDRLRINAVPEVIALGGSTVAAPPGTLMAHIQGTEVFRFRLNGAPDANDIVYPVGERVTVRLNQGDQIFFGA